MGNHATLSAVAMPKASPEMDTHAERLHASIGELGGHVEALTKRLSSVLSQDEVTTANNAQPAHPPARSHFGRAMQDAGARLDALTRQVLDLQDRLCC